MEPSTEGQDAMSEELRNAFIRIPIGEEIVLFMRVEPDIQGAEDLADLLQEYGTMDVARMTLASRHLGHSPEGILSADKMLLLEGTAAEVAAIVRKLTVEKKIKGKKMGGEMIIKAPRLAGPTDAYAHKDNGEAGSPEVPGAAAATGSTHVLSLTPEAVERAKSYLFKNVPGQIEGRLRILMVNDVPLGPVVAELKDLIDALVEDLEG